MTQFLLDTIRNNDALVVVMSGEIDEITAPVLSAIVSSVLPQDDVATLRLDMSHISRLDRSGLDVLARLHCDATAHGKCLAVKNLQRGPRQLMQDAGLSALLG